MTEYQLYERLSDWEEDEVMVVEIVDRDTATVRTYYQTHLHGPLPVREAFEAAHRFMGNHPGIERIAVFLHEGVEWSSDWVTLKPK